MCTLGDPVLFRKLAWMVKYLGTDCDLSWADKFVLGCFESLWSVKFTMRMFQFLVHLQVIPLTNAFALRKSGLW